MHDVRNIRLFWVVAAALSLAACNMVTTEKPLFAPNDLSHLKYRNGLWAQDADSWRSDDVKSCTWNEAAPASSWPACATHVVVRDERFPIGDATPVSMQDMSLGDPAILQIFAGDVASAKRPYRAAAKASTAAPYFYFGVELTSDPGGRVIHLREWPVLCGPPSETPGPLEDIAKQAEAAKDARQASPLKTPTLPASMKRGSDRPFAGLVMDELRLNCMTASQDALRQAAGRTRTLDPPIVGWRWVRDGDR